MSNGARSTSGATDSVGIQATLLRFAVLFVVLLIALPIVVDFVVPSDALQAVWIESTEAARLQRTYGFVLEVRAINVSGHRLWLPVISSVTPGGRMAREGVRPGDVVMCIPNGRSAFWHELLAADEGYEGYEATFHLSQPGDVQLGCAGARTIVLAGRKRPREM